MKALVAYSSVAHMGLVICGLISLYHWGVRGALVIIIGHGVCSSGLFCAVNIYYERSGRRAFYINRGVIGVLPVFALMFFLLCAANIAAPPTICLLSEVFLMGGIIKYDYLMLLFFPLGSYLGAVFTLFLFSYSQHGKCYRGVYSFSFTSELEIHLIIIHLVPLNLIFLKFEFFLSSF
jgi:NADH-ubiquinone oxidoreductase chain 4